MKNFYSFYKQFLASSSQGGAQHSIIVLMLVVAGNWNSFETRVLEKTLGHGKIREETTDILEVYQKYVAGGLNFSTLVPQKIFVRDTIAWYLVHRGF